MKFVAVSTVGTLLLAGSAGVQAQTTNSDANQSAEAIRSQMDSLRQEMDQRMNALQKQLSALQQSNSHATKPTQTTSANNESQNLGGNNVVQGSTGGSNGNNGNNGNQASALEQNSTQATKPTQSASANNETQNTQANNAAQNPASGSGSSSSTAKKIEKNTDIGGILELGYNDPFDSNNESDRGARGSGGDLNFNKFSINVTGSVGNFIYSGDYRWYGYANLLHYGWFGYKFSDDDNIKVGLIQAPFGNMPYGYLSYYGGLPYYLGFNDNQNAGVVYSHSGLWDVDVAFFKDLQLDTGPDHYGSNPVTSTDALGQDQENRGVNQGDVRIGYNFGKGTDYVTNVSLSGKGGEFYNDETNDAGTNWAAAAAVNGVYGNLQTMVQFTAYKYNPDNPDGVSDDLVQFGSFATNYLVPAKGQLYQASVGYTIPINWGILKSVTVSDDYSLLHVGSGIDYRFTSTTQDLSDPQVNDVGAYWDASPFFMWTDVVSGKNFLGFIGKPDNSWHNSAYVELGVAF